MRTRSDLDATQIGWRIGTALEPRGGELWCPWDRTTGVIGPQGSGKTLDILIPALLQAPGAAMVTLTKPNDLLLTLAARQADDRPVAVLDPFGLVDGLPELVWDPIAGCTDPWLAERRARAFCAGTVKGASHAGTGDAAARFYAEESSKVLRAYLHAAALVGATLDEVLRWVANPTGSPEPAEILLSHPDAASHWHGLLQGALTGDDRTAGNTVTTVQQAMGLFFQPAIRQRCVPTAGRPATDIADLLRRHGTIYMLGRQDPYASAAPLMTAAAEDILDTGLALANASPWGRLSPPMLSCLDELPSTAPLPTLLTRVANERALGLSFVWASQTRAQLVSVYGEDEARTLIGLANVLAVFGGSKDPGFNRDVSDLIGTVRVARTTWQTGGRGHSYSAEDIPILRPEEIRRIPERQALLIAEHLQPILAQLTRCIDGKAGQQLLSQQAAIRDRLARRDGRVPARARAIASLAHADQHELSNRGHR
ncbi:MAG: type IV secretory system conjugative DNA transfer family protein [Propionibacteriaceae bacterium]|nr:TraM recognition domain-containing protein [Actinomycetota bacterium]MCW5953247.1 type IV secretory system conjugative DNA transfer family protein [Propionibacteriaceae bacterium]